MHTHLQHKALNKQTKTTLKVQRRVMKKKIISVLIAAALALSLSLSLAACNDDETKYADVLVVGSTMQIDTLNRLDADGGQPGYNYDILSASLTQMTPVYASGGKYYPQICTYSTSSNGLVWAFDVKSGYTWHDGKPVTDDDFLYTFQSSFVQGTDYESVSTMDEKIVITLLTPNANYLSKIAVLRLYPKHIFEGKNKETLTNADSVIGCGPFKFSGRNIENNTVTFVKYDAYPDADAIAFDTVIMKFYGTEDVMHMALKSGEIDMEYNYSYSISADAETDFKDESNIKLISYAAKKMPKILFFNNDGMTAALGADKAAKVKKAVQKAIDYHKIRASFGTSMSSASYEGFISPAIFGYSETNVLTRDLDAAKALLSEAGYSTENKYKFELLLRSGTNDSQYASLLKTALEETGMIEVSFNEKATADWQAYYKTGKHTACLGSVTAAGFDMQAGLATKYFLAKDTSALTENPVCYGNYSLENGENITEFGKIYYALANAATTDEYLTAAKNFQNFAVKETPAVSLLTDTVVQAYSNKLSGFVIDDNFGLFSVENFKTLKKAA